MQELFDLVKLYDYTIKCVSTPWEKEEYIILRNYVISLIKDTFESDL